MIKNKEKESGEYHIKMYVKITPKEDMLVDYEGKIWRLLPHWMRVKRDIRKSAGKLVLVE